MIFELTACEEIIGYKFKDIDLFRNCFVHSSYTNEHYGIENNERLEFFGDAIMDFLVTEYLMAKYPNENEGRLTDRRKDFVAKEPLTKAVFALGLDKYLILGKSVENNRDPNEKLYSSVYEAVVAGIYIDGGLAPARKFVKKTLIDFIESSQAMPKKVVKKTTVKDYKSALQEFMQKNKMGIPEYQSISKEGPDNNPVFTEAVLINGKIVAKACGKSKKSAQQIGAKAVYEKLLRSKERSINKSKQKNTPAKKQAKPNNTRNKGNKS